MQITNETDVRAASTAELVAWYNEHTDQPVKKFADRKTAERRVLAKLPAPAPEDIAKREVESDAKAKRDALAEPAARQAAPKPTPKTDKTVYVNGRKVAAKPKKLAQEATQPKKAEKGTKAAPEPKAKDKKANAAPDHETLSDAQRRTWKDPEVREARCERSSVSVNGVDYKSVRAAFEELELPISQHIKFRGRLKEAGKLKEYGYTWEIIPLNY